MNHDFEACIQPGFCSNLIRIFLRNTFDVLQCNSIQIQYISFCKVDLLSITNGSRCCTNTYVKDHLRFHGKTQKKKDHLLSLQQHNSVIYYSRNVFFLKKGDCWKNGWSSFIPIEMLRTITIEEKRPFL